MGVILIITGATSGSTGGGQTGGGIQTGGTRRIITSNTRGYWINSTGEPQELDSWEITPFIDIPAGMTQISGKGVWWDPGNTAFPKFAFYDAQGAFISGNNTLTNAVDHWASRAYWGSTTIFIPSNAAKLRIAYPTPVSDGGNFGSNNHVPEEYDVQGFSFE